MPHLASDQRERTAQVTTRLGALSIARSYYLCAECGHGQHPLDDQLQFCAGSRSQALDELLALLGATQDSFVQAAQVLERLNLMHVSANSVREATETLGALAPPGAQRASCQPRLARMRRSQANAAVYQHGWGAGAPARARLE